MSGTIKRSCIWLTIIHSSPGDEFYCEISQNPAYFNCDNCKMYLNIADAKEFVYRGLKLLEIMRGGENDS